MNDFRDHFATSDTNLSAYLLAATGRQPEICRQDGQNLVTFKFRRDSKLSRLIEEYLSGEATISARAVLSARSRIFHMVRNFERGGGL